MKILFYIEPHAIRDSFLHMQLPFRYVADITRQFLSHSNEYEEKVDCRILANHLQINCSIAKYYDIWPYMISPLPKHQEFIEESAKMWRSDGVKDWLGLMNDENSELTKFYCSMLSEIRDSVFEFDAIVTWGQSAVVTSFCQENNLQSVFLELASCRSPFISALMMDPVGVNGHASTCTIPIEVIEQAVSPINNDLLFNLINNESDSNGRQASGLMQNRYYPLDNVVQDFIASGEKTALVPLQLSDDANVLLYSHFEDIIEFATDTVDKLLADGWNVILKGHPSAPARGGEVSRQQEFCLKKYEDNDRVLTIGEKTDPSQYLALLRSVDFIVTNNSSVGFEGMLMGKDTIALSKAAYKPLNSMPTLEDFIVNPAGYKAFKELIPTYLFAASFPIKRRVDIELYKRIKFWKKYPFEPTLNWVKETLNDYGWHGWHNKDYLRELTLK